MTNSFVLNEATTDRGEGSGCCGAVPQLRLTVEEAEHYAEMLKAIAHPVRLQIVDLLSRQGGEICVCDIEQCFSLKQPTISHHLKVLRQAGLINSERRGLWAYYHTVPGVISTLRKLLGGLSNSPAGSLS